ncbi:hypothetical protein [Sodalis sp.]|uniref:hypothetical protein n=1 Tax=Sodalis sp. (in: enterobacteria) TaxID=1898979 RepID=UPI003872C042
MLGIIAVASYQTALNFSLLMFTLPLSVGVVVTIRIGFRLGEAVLSRRESAPGSG